MIDDGKPDVTYQVGEEKIIQFDHCQFEEKIEIVKRPKLGVPIVEMASGRVKICLKLWQGTPNTGYDDIPTERTE